MDTQAVFSEFPSELSDALEIGERLDIADSAADLGVYKIKVARIAEFFDVAFDLVGYVRHYLHGLAEVVAAAFFVDDALIYPSGGDIVGFCGLDVGETFVVAKIKVGLMAVDGYITLSVFIWV